SLAVVMSVARAVLRQFRKIAIVSSIVLFAGCYFAPYFANRAAGGGTDTAEGEQHDVPYNVNDSFVLTQDVLRGEGVLFEVKPDDKLLTLWKDADTGAGLLGSLVGVHPQYRYEIEVVPNGDRSSRIIVNVPTEDLKALARRATGNEDNWRQIAQDNGLKSPADAANLPSVWISNTLLSQPKKEAPTGN